MYKVIFLCALAWIIIIFAKYNVATDYYYDRAYVINRKMQFWLKHKAKKNTVL